jgi:BMFP domain-containing protein YqiC
MEKFSQINDLSNKIIGLLESSPVSDVKKNMHALIQGAFTKMELVSREEFDTQAAALANAQSKLSALESKLAALESLLNQAQK